MGRSTLPCSLQSECVARPRETCGDGRDRGRIVSQLSMLHLSSELRRLSVLRALREHHLIRIGFGKSDRDRRQPVTYELLIHDAAWEISQRGRVLAKNHSRQPIIAQGLERLRGAIVKTVAIGLLETNFAFDKSLQLDITSQDHPGFKASAMTSWTLFFRGERVLSIGARSYDG